MKKKPSLLLVIALCLSVFTTMAQNDSSYLDLGRVKIRKDFTQTVTIKGTDLEKMPFSSIEEVVNTWFYRGL